MKNASLTDNPVSMGSERSQLLVRIPTDHALLVKRMAARAGMSLTDYIDALIVADIEAKAAEISAEVSSWREQTVIEAEAQAERETAALANIIRNASSTS